jgi:hypothetical protein
MSPMSPDESFRCGEHDARLESHSCRIDALEDEGADRERRLTTLEAEWRSRMRLVASYVTPVLLVIAAELLKLYVFKR